MILSFKKQFPDKIKDGTKIHTIREDPTNRWKVGKEIHFATGVRTKNYNQFMSGECKSVQMIKIWWEKLEQGSQASQMKVAINGSVLDPMTLHFLATNDGFQNTTEFACWFSKDFVGKIIHWTDYRYD